MKLSSLIYRIALAMALLCGGSAVLAAESQQKTFATPEDAVVAMVDAARGGDTNQLLAIFGPDAKKVLFSGDPVMDQRNREVFLVAYAERAALMSVSPTRSVLYVGYEDWPMPIPIVKEAAAWRFDTAAGAQEILFRRIGRNELDTIEVCQVYVDAQQEYAATAHDGKPAGIYAQKGRQHARQARRPLLEIRRSRGIESAGRIRSRGRAGGISARRRTGDAVSRVRFSDSDRARHSGAGRRAQLHRQR